MELPKLGFPEYNFKVQNDSEGGQSLKIFDIIRQKYVFLSPEEWVRQHLIHFLVNERGYSRSLIGVEKKLLVNNLNRRSDLLVYSRQHLPLLLAECKAPSVPITQKAFDQAARYNLSYDVKYFVLTNGLMTCCCMLDHEARSYFFLPEIPSFDSIA